MKDIKLLPHLETQSKEISDTIKWLDENHSIKYRIHGKIYDCIWYYRSSSFQNRTDCIIICGKKRYGYIWTGVKIENFGQFKRKIIPSPITEIHRKMIEENKPQFYGWYSKFV